MNEFSSGFSPDFFAAGAASSLAPLERERALFLYRSALERGDTFTVDRVLQMAETDAALETMILESHALDLEEIDAEEAAPSSASGWDVSEIREALALHLSDDTPNPGAVFAPSEMAPGEMASASVNLAPFTLADVAARMQSDSTQRPPLAALPHDEFAHLTQQLRGIPLPLPGQLDERALSQIFKNLGIVASSDFQDGFRETANFLYRHRATQERQQRPE